MAVFGFFKEIQAALDAVFSANEYRWLAIISFVGIAAFSWLLPVYTIPGNDAAFWFKVAPSYSYVFLFLFSAAMAVLIPMQVFVWRQRASLPEKGAGAAGLFSGVMATVYSSAACAGCITAFGAFLGGGATLFLLNYRSELIAGGLLLTLVSIYFTAQTVNRKCTTCVVALPMRNEA